MENKMETILIFTDDIITWDLDIQTQKGDHVIGLHK